MLINDLFMFYFNLRELIQLKPLIHCRKQCQFIIVDEALIEKKHKRIRWTNDLQFVARSCRGLDLYIHNMCV